MFTRTKSNKTSQKKSSIYFYHIKHSYTHTDTDRERETLQLIQKLEAMKILSQYLNANPIFVRVRFISKLNRKIS